MTVPSCFQAAAGAGSKPPPRGGGGGGHSPWLWVPIVKRTSGAVAVNAVEARKRGAITDPSTCTLRRGTVRGGLLYGSSSTWLV